MSAHENNFNNESEPGVLSQENVDGQKSSYFPTLYRQQEDLTRLIKGVFTPQRPKFFPRVGTRVDSRANGTSPNMMNRGTGTLPDRLRLANPPLKH